MMIDPVHILKRYYDPDSETFNTLMIHGKMVGQKALAIAKKLHHLNPDKKFIGEAAMLHDIGIWMTHTPQLGCTGDHPYICHGVLGKKLLEREGLHQHARVCENHVGVGISLEDVRLNGLPLPEKNMLPETLEEEIICYADKFFSKNINSLGDEIPIEKIIKDLEPHGKDKVARFLAWKDRFEC